MSDVLPRVSLNGIHCSKRFDQVYDETKNIWHSQQYLLTREYHSRAPLFPPFSVLFDVYRLIRMGFFRVRKACGKNEDPEKDVFSESERMFTLLPIATLSSFCSFRNDCPWKRTTG
jgi:hypothetical protein